MERQSVPVPTRRSYHSPLRREQAAATRERILAAAERHLATDPEELSFPQIAKLAGVSLPTVHRQFPDRRALYEGLSERSEREHPFVVPESAEQLIALTPQFVARWSSVSPLQAALSRSRAAQAVRREFGHGEKRAYLTRLFARTLAPLPAGDRRAMEDALMFLTAATSVQVLTGALGLEPERASAALQWLLRAAVGHAERAGRKGAPGKAKLPAGIAKPSKADSKRRGA